MHVRLLSLQQLCVLLLQGKQLRLRCLLLHADEVAVDDDVTQVRGHLQQVLP